MDFNRLSANEKLAVYGSVAVIVGGIVSVGIGGLGLLAVLAAIGMLAVVFLPQLSPRTTLPGSNGTLMLILGGVAAVVMLLALLTILGALGFFLQFAPVNAIFFLVAVVGGLVMGWAGWQAFQAEGGRFVLGTPGAGASTSRTAGTGPADAAGSDARTAAADARRDDDEDRPAPPPA